MMLHAHNAAHLQAALQALDTAAEALEDSCNTCLADLPAPAEYKYLTLLTSALTVLRAVVKDQRAAAAGLWPNESE